MNISAWAIRSPIAPLVCFVPPSLAGVASFLVLPINLYPDPVFPVVDVAVSEPGASPEELETQVAQKMEAAPAGVDNVRDVFTDGASRLPDDPLRAATIAAGCRDSAHDRRTAFQSIPASPVRMMRSRPCDTVIAVRAYTATA
jgi:hypothetical protein